MLNLLTVVGALVVIFLILVDAFETIVLPRRVTRRFRLSAIFLRRSWQIYRHVARRLPTRVGREGSSIRDRFLSIFGPAALLVLLAIWAGVLVLSFALLYRGTETRLAATSGQPDFRLFLYLSGETFFTLGYGDIAPTTGVGRAIAVAEVATGFSFLALIIGYLPGIFQAFSRREAEIMLLDARAGSPPSATELLRRHAGFNDTVALENLLQDWERWSAEFLESHLSYPILTLFRSQHDHLSWLAAVTMILDACTLLMVGVESATGRLPSRQARLTFAMARHVAGDLSQILYTTPRTRVEERLPAAAFAEMRAILASAGLRIREGPEAEHWLVELRRLYEPYVQALSEQLLVPLPSWLPSAQADDWQTTAWEWEPAVLPPCDPAESRAPLPPPTV